MLFEIHEGIFKGVVWDGFFTKMNCLGMYFHVYSCHFINKDVQDDKIVENLV